MSTFPVDPSTARRGMGQRPMLGLTRRTYPMQCSHRPHAARLALPAALEGTMLHRCRRAHTGHRREALPSPNQCLPTCLISRYSFCCEITTIGTSVSGQDLRSINSP